MPRLLFTYIIERHLLRCSRRSKAQNLNDAQAQVGIEIRGIKVMSLIHETRHPDVKDSILLGEIFMRTGSRVFVKHSGIAPLPDSLGAFNFYFQLN